MLKTILFFNWVLISFFFCNDRIAAVVGDRVILESSVNEQVGAFLSNNPSLALNKEDVRLEVLDYLIEQEVLVYFAKKDSLLGVSPDEINTVVGDRLSFFEKQFGSIDALEGYFGVPYIEIKSILKTEAENMLLAERFKQKLFSFTSISNTEVEVFYSTYKDSLPLTPVLYDYTCIERDVAPNNSSLKETKALADLVFSQIQSGDSFFEDFYSLYSGGNLGFFRRGTFIPEFEVVAFSLKEGEISSPVLSSLGYHIIKLNRRAGEKIDVSHILFPLSITEEDRASVYTSLNKLKSSSFSGEKIDSLGGVLKNSCGGVFFDAPKENIPTVAFKGIDSISSLPGFSEVLPSGENSFVLIYLKNKKNPTVPDLYEFWGFVEGLALERKFYSFYSDWYQQKKEEVYIDIR